MLMVHRRPDGVLPEKQHSDQCPRIDRVSRLVFTTKVDGCFWLEFPTSARRLRDALEHVSVREDQIFVDQKARSNVLVVHVDASDARNRVRQAILARQ